MAINNRKTAILLPLLIAFTLICGIYIGMKLSYSGINDRLLIYPRVDKVNSLLNLIEDSYVDTISRNDLEVTAIESILQTLDPHSVFIPAKDLAATNEPLEGNFSGIGIHFNNFSDTIIVVSTIKGGPSEKVGLISGDRIVQINNQKVAGVKLATDSIVKMLKGKRNTDVNVSIKRRGVRKLLTFTITRNVIPIFSIDAAFMTDSITGYIKINKFAKTTHQEFLTAAKNLHKKGMKRIIVDLRGNGGGILESTIAIADEFLDSKKLIVYTQGRSRPRKDSYSTEGGECVADSVIVIIDEHSASASEILAGAIQDNDRGWIVGRRSFGKGLVQEQSTLPGGNAIRLTIARYYTPTGRCIQKSYKNGKSDYYNEINERVANGELEQADSVHFNDSLRYITPKGRIVFGGGGIMPDIFVPADTSFYSSFYFNIHKQGVINRFSFIYTETNRSKLARLKTIQQQIDFLEKDAVFEKMLKYAESQNIPVVFSEVKKSEIALKTELEASIIRYTFDENGFYEVMNKTDKTLQRANKL